MQVKSLMRLARAEHWIKNALVFLPPFFLGVMFRKSAMLAALPAFLSFSLAASAVYAFNDIFDCEKDRTHPLKRSRPVASGEVSKRSAAAFGAVLAAVSFAAVPFAHSPVMAGTVLSMYICTNLAYSAHFKNTPLIDIFLLASGFVFRIFYGGFFFGVAVSSWLFLCIFSGALYFACGKRRMELIRLGGGSPSRSVLKSYTDGFLGAHYYSFFTLSILFYCLWTVTRTDQHAVGKLALTIPVLIFVMARYNYLLESGKADGDPVPVLLHDPWLMAGALAFAAMNFVILYLGEWLPRVVY